MSLPDEMVARLVCPVTRAPLRRDGEWLVSDAAGLAFPIVRGVPRLVPEQARPTA
ncbi:hypothetical protein GGR88_002363 [Sphingomonas jejuensis]|uniref:Uncharacterized protein n=1 Tax=Sphingomonas jejuensis TaxID=904715 RepID=A0ABX0XNM7_9SPHN|nr:Trm112 family protein [Sphingomonas jejuensis]NJC34849.1 hypothetical protein [Sphingomonas jejuensis]